MYKKWRKRYNRLIDKQNIVKIVWKVTKANNKDSSFLCRTLEALEEVKKMWADEELIIEETNTVVINDPMEQ